MQIEITYPERSKRSRFMVRLLRVLEWASLAAAVICPIVNYFVGGKAWSVVVLWGLYMFWQLLLSPDLVDRNLISQTVKGIWHICILLGLIDRLLSPGWASFVIPIVAFSGIILTVIFYLADRRTQRQNAMPMIWLILFSLAFAVASMLGLLKLNWPMMVLGGLSVTVSVLGLAAFHKDLFLELKKRFHTS